MSAVGPGAFLMIGARYLPRPSCVMPLSTVTPMRGTSVNLNVQLGSAKMASERSFPTLVTLMSKAAENSTSCMW